MIAVFEWCKIDSNWLYPTLLIVGISWAIGYIISKIPKHKNENEVEAFKQGYLLGQKNKEKQ
jgi:hypothetical protein